MLIKIECPCNTNYEFEVEPEAGQMPFAVQCPSCGADGTVKANEVIAGAATQAPPAVPLPPLVSPPVRAASLRPAASKPKAAVSPETRGLLGAIAGAFLATLAWYLTIVFTGYAIGIVAWGVGAVTGLGARMLAQDASEKLGWLAGGCALIAIISGQYLALSHAVDKKLDGIVTQAYESHLAFAQSATKATTDEAIKTILVDRAKEDDDEKAAGSISAKDVTDFRQNELPELTRLVQGKPSKKEWISATKSEIQSKLSWTILKNSVGLFTVLWIALGVGSAYKIASGNND